MLAPVAGAWQNQAVQHAGTAAARALTPSRTEHRPQQGQSAQGTATRRAQRLARSPSEPATPRAPAAHCF